MRVTSHVSREDLAHPSRDVCRQGIEIKFVEPPEARMPTLKVRGSAGQGRAGGAERSCRWRWRCRLSWRGGSVVSAGASWRSLLAAVSAVVAPGWAVILEP